MNRVWKRFLLKVGKVVGIIALGVSAIVGTILLLLWLGVNPNLAVPIVLLIGVVSPMIIIILYQVYKDCEDEVARENRKIMNDIRGF
jgi:uncharacterized membrane protein